MKTPFAKKLFTKILIGIMVFTMIAPYANVANATATATGRLIVTMSQGSAAGAGFRVFNTRTTSPVIAEAPAPGETILPNVAVTRTITEGTYDVRFEDIAGFDIEITSASGRVRTPGLLEGILMISGNQVNVTVNYVPEDPTPTGELRVTMSQGSAAGAGFRVFNTRTTSPVIAEAPAPGETILPNVAVTRTITEGTYDVTFNAISGFRFPPELLTESYSINNDGTVANVVIASGTPVALAVNYLVDDATPTGELNVTLSQGSAAGAGFKVFNARTNTPTIAEAPEPGETITPNVPVERTLREGTYDIQFYTIHGFQDPPTVTPSYAYDTDRKVFKDIVITAGTPVNLLVNYTPENHTPTGTLRVTMNHGDGSFVVFNAGTSSPVIASATASEVTQNVPVNRTLPEGTYDVVFGPVAGFFTPATVEDVVITENDVTPVSGNYTAIPNTGTVTVNVTNQDGNAITDGNWQLKTCAGASLSTCTAPYSNGTGSATMTNAPANRYGLFWSLSGTPYTSALVLSANPQSLAPQGTIVFNLEYSETSMRTARLNVTTRVDNGDVGPDILNPGTARVTLLVDGVVTETRTAPVTFFVDVSRQNTLRFSDTVPDASPPADVIFAAEVLADDETRDIEGVYTTKLAEINVTATVQLEDGTQTPLPAETPVDIFIGPSDARGEPLSTAPENPVSRIVNVVDAPIEEIFCGESRTHRFLGENPIAITTAHGQAGSYTCLYEERDLTTISVTARREDASPGTFEAVAVELFQGDSPTGVSLGTQTTNASGVPVVFGDIDITNNYYLVFPEIDDAEYLRPTNSALGVYVLSSSDLEEGAAEVVDGLYRLRNATISVTVSGLAADETTTVKLYRGTAPSGSAEETVTVGNTGDDSVIFTITDPSGEGEPFTVTCASPLPSGKVTQTGQNEETFTVVARTEPYSHTCSYVDNAAFLNVQTTPIPATVMVVNLNDADAPVTSRTSVLVPPATYETALLDRVLIPVTDALERVRVAFNPAPGLPGTTTAYQAPDASEFAENLDPGSTRLVGPAAYTETLEKEFLNLSTFGVDDAAIYVDGIEVRTDGNDIAVTVPISTTEIHTVSFAAAVGFVTPDPIVLEPGNLDVRRGQTRNFLGYYVEAGQDHTFVFRSRNTTGDVFLRINGDETQYLIGTTRDSEPPLMFRTDVQNRHEFSFEDKRPAFVLQTEQFVFEADALTAGETTGVTATYIPFANAAHLRFGVENTDDRFFLPVVLSVTHADSTLETFALTPTPADPDNITGTTFTDVFVVDAANETNMAIFESPLTLDSEEFTATPQDTFTLDNTSFPGGQTEGAPGSSTNPYPVTVEYAGSLNLATITVRAVGSSTDTVTLLTTEDDGTTTSLVAGPLDDGDEAVFTSVRIDQDHVIRCGDGTSSDPVTTPVAISIPAGSLSAGENPFPCLYVSTSNMARITVETTSADDPDLSAPIVLSVDGTDYFMGTTLPQTDPSLPSRLRFNVDATLTNLVHFGDVAGYAAPSAITVDAPVGTTTRVYRGTYIPETQAARITINTRLSDTGELTDAPANNMMFGALTSGMNTLTQLIDVSMLPILVHFEDNIDGYVQPLDLVLNSTNVRVGDNTFDAFYVPEASAAYIAVNTVGAEGEVFLNGNSLGTSVGETYLGPVLIDTEDSNGNVIGFGSADIGFVKPFDIKIPQGTRGFSANPASPTQFTGLYIDARTGEAFTVYIFTVRSDNGFTVDDAEVRMDGRIVGYSPWVQTTVGSGSHQVTFGDLSGFVTPLPVDFTSYYPQESVLNIFGFYIPEGNAYKTVTIRTVDDQVPANPLNAPIRFNNIDEVDYNAFIGFGVATLNIDETATANEIRYNSTFTDPATGETYDLVSPADGVEELTAPYSDEYLGVYHLPTFGTADLSTADDDADYLTGVENARIILNSSLARCFLFNDPNASISNDARLVIDADCNNLPDSDEFALNIGGVGNGTTGVIAEVANFSVQSGRSNNTPVSGLLSVMDPDLTNDDDHFFWFDEDADGNPDTNEVVLSRQENLVDADILDATLAPGATERILTGGNSAYARVATLPFLIHDFRADTERAGMVLDGDFNLSTYEPSSELVIDLIGEDDDLTFNDDFYVGGVQRVENFEFESDVPTTVTWGNHPTDDTYHTPLPVYFTPVSGRVYPPIVGAYTHSCEVNVEMVDETGAPLAGEVTMRTDRNDDGSVDDDPDFYYGTGAPGTGLVEINLNENLLNVITVTPLPNTLGLVASPSTITIPADSLDPALSCPATYTVTIAVPETDAFFTIRTVDNDGADVNGTIMLNGTPVSDANGDIVDFAVDPLVENTFTFGDLTGYLTPNPIAFPVGTLNAGDRRNLTALYFISARAAYIAVNTVGAEGEVSLNGASLGTSVAEAYLGPVRIDTGRTGGNTIRFGDVIGFITPNDLVIPEDQTGLSSDEVNPTQYTGRYLQPEISGTLNVTALLSDSGMVVTNATLRLDDQIIGYGFVNDMLVPAGAHTLSFGSVEGLITPLNIDFTIAALETVELAGVYIPEGHAFRAVTIRTVDDQTPANALGAPIRFSIDGGANVFPLGTGAATLNVDETLDTNQIIYNTAFTDPATGETYDLVSPADGVEELTAPYSDEYLGVYHLPTFGTADLSTADDDADYLTGVAGTEISVNAAVVGAQRIVDFEFEADVPATVSWGNHPTDDTYHTPLPVYFTPVSGRVYPPIVGAYTHSCEVNVEMVDETGAPLAGEVTMRTDRNDDGSVDDDPDFYYGTGAPGTGLVEINLNENLLNVITVTPLPNALGLVASPSTITIPADSLNPALSCPATYTVTFAPPETDAFITIRTVDDAGADVIGTILHNGTPVSDAQGDIIDFRVDPLVNNTFTFGALDADHTTPAAISFDAGTLAAAERRTLSAVYARIVRTATLTLQARDGANPALRIGAPISLITNGGAPVLVGTDDVVAIPVDISNTYAVLWGDVTNYGTPALNPTPVAPLTENEDRTITGNYTFCPTCRDVTIRALNAADDTALAGARITVNGAEAGFGTITRFEPIGTELTISFDPLPGFEAPVLDFVNPVTVEEDDVDPLTNVFTARYTATEEFVLNFDAEDNTGAPLDGASLSVMNDGSMEELPFRLVSDNPNRVFVYQAVPGLTTPSAFTIAGETFTVPRGIRVVETSGAGVTTTFNEGDDVTLRISPFTYAITGIYTPEFTLTKTVDRTLVNNNEVVRFTIRLERLSAAAGAIEADIRDTVTTITNGGELTYIIGSTQLSGRDLVGSDCTLGAPEINSAVPIRCTLPAAGDVATVIYDMRANNTTIPVGTTSRLTNTASVSYATLPAPMTAAATVEIRGPEPVGPIVAVEGGAGRTGNGGGHIFFKGNMNLGIRKFVSLDGMNFKEALSSESAFALPENRLSALTVKVVIENDTEFSANNIRFRQSFERGGSDMNLEGLMNLEGARFDPKFGTIVVDKVRAGTTHEFTYTLNLREDGTNPATALEKLELVHFGSGLPTVQDGLTYAGIGNEFVTYFRAGPALVGEPDPGRSETENIALPAETDPKLNRQELLSRRLSHTGEAPVVPAAGSPSEEVERPYELARTGAASTLSILMLLILSALGYQFYQERRYIILKQAALQPL